MENLDLDVERFIVWLREYEDDIVGYPGIWFNDLLSEWISGMIGRVCGVVDRMYGSALCDVCQWYWFPFWARRFVVLAQIEERNGRL